MNSILMDDPIPTSAVLRFAHALWSERDNRPFEQFENGSYFAKTGVTWVAKDQRLQAALNWIRVKRNQGKGKKMVRFIGVGELEGLVGY